MAKKDKETKLDKKIRSIFPFIAGLAFLVLLFIAFYYFFQGIGKVEYQGLTFTREKIGQILVYSYDYIVKTPEGKIIQNTLYLRHNPGKNNVSVEGAIVYPEGKRVMISINSTGLKECEDSMIAIATLTNFLVANSLEVKGGTPDKEEAKNNNLSYVSCDNYMNNPVIAIKSYNETKIVRDKDSYCYNLYVADCRIQQTVEKFIVQSIIDAKKNIAKPPIKAA